MKREINTRLRRARQIRRKISGLQADRLCVHRTPRHIYAQIIDKTGGKVLASASTVEPDVQWRAIITNGGPARAFSEIMPAFGDLLTQDQIGRVIQYLRTLCDPIGRVIRQEGPPGEIEQRAEVRAARHAPQQLLLEATLLHDQREHGKDRYR